MVLKFIEQGELFDENFDRWEIPPSTKRYKDTYVVGHRRSVLLTHKALIKREYEKHVALETKKRERQAGNKTGDSNDQSEPLKKKRGRPIKNSSPRMTAMNNSIESGENVDPDDEVPFYEQLCDDIDNFVSFIV